MGGPAQRKHFDGGQKDGAERGSSFNTRRWRGQRAVFLSDSLGFLRYSKPLRSALGSCCTTSTPMAEHGRVIGCAVVRDCTPGSRRCAFATLLFSRFRWRKFPGSRTSLAKDASFPSEPMCPRPAKLTRERVFSHAES